MIALNYGKGFALHGLLLSYAFHSTLCQDQTQRTPGLMITDEELNATYTHLVGFEGCDRQQQREISQAYWDAGAILNGQNIRQTFPNDDGIDWNLHAAIEFLGAPFSDPWRRTIQDLYNNAATYQEWYIAFPTDVKINTRCDDPLNKCLCVPSNMFAYTTNIGGSNNNGPYMNFCPKFFAQNSLSAALNDVLRRPDNEKFDLNFWSNQAETFMHEMFHIDRVAQSPPNLHVTDMWMHTRLGLKQAYGAEMAKILARTMNNNGQYVLQNAENLMYFAMATHYQTRLNGRYPPRPFAKDVPVGNPMRNRPYSIFNITDNGMLEVWDEASNEDEFILTASTCDSEPVVTVSADTATFARDSDYPADYQSSLSSWMADWDTYWATADASTSDAPSATIGSPTSVSALPTSAPTTVQARCSCSYNVLFDAFVISGANFKPEDLKKQLDGCGLVTDWNVQTLNLNSDGMQFKATGKLPIGTKACIGRAVVSAGGSTADQCTGPG